MNETAFLYLVANRKAALAHELAVFAVPIEAVAL
jgi:hypothetical protein